MSGAGSDEPDADQVLDESDFDELDIHAVAKQLKCSIGDVIALVNNGDLQAYQLGEKVWFRSSEVAALKKKQALSLIHI